MQQNNIDYNWDQSTEADIFEQVIETGDETARDPKLATRHNLQLARRLFHMANGSVFATLYLLTLTHSQMIHLLGTLACVLYLVEQIRINYPEKAAKFIPFTKFIMRAEEQLKESAMVPYAMAVLLTVITFPKPIALVGIYTLAFADPLSAIVGIRFGKHKITPTRTLEGSTAFFIASFLCCFGVLAFYTYSVTFLILGISFLLGLVCCLFEMLPLKIDDNLTIPLFTSAALWTLVTLFEIF
ncbi:MAG: hypothetical protein CME62_16890 [Halobacteriovoraceae bacterium]|nr:hypothetical protein [Halobacteriovoraceae bacterium]|tara:strand:+ start:18963 stop:19688 length:726 start_codon:yes stop_codon:yes gene_type:complete